MAVKPLELQQLASCYGGGNGARRAGSWANLHGCTLPGDAGSANGGILLPRQSGGHAITSLENGKQEKVSSSQGGRVCVVGNNQFSPWR